ncbi:MAG: hypothetical protein AAGI01_15140, partial [Myxococcota bacterium]
LEELAELPRVQTVKLEPLAEASQRELLDTLVKLEEPLPTEIMNLSRGNPMFAVQLIGDWIQRDILEPGGTGYHLKPGAEAFLPETLEQLWTTRLGQLVSAVRLRSPHTTDEQIRGVLEIAAAIGQEVPFEEWAEACRRADLLAPEPLLESLITQGFATADRHYWSFTHEPLRELLVTEAREAQRWESHNLACAAMIDTLYDKLHPTAPARLTTYLLEARAWDLSVDPLLYLMDLSLLQCNDDGVHVLSSKIEHALHEARAPMRDIRWGKYRRRAAAYARSTRGLRPALQLLERTLEEALEYGWGELLGALYADQAELMWLAGDLDASAAACARGGEFAADAGDQHTLIECFCQFAMIHAYRHEMRDAKEYVRAALGLLKGLKRREDPKLIDALCGRTYHVLGHVHMRDDRQEHATIAFKNAEHFFKAAGAQRELWINHTYLGELARIRGNFDAAERFYVDAYKRLGELRRPVRSLPYLYYALMLLEEKAYPLARDALLEMMSDLKGLGFELYSSLAHIALAASYAGLKDMNQWSSHHHRAVELLRAHPICDMDIAGFAEFTGSLHSAQHQHQAALASYELALMQWRALERDDRVRQVLHLINLTHDQMPR